MMITMSFAVTNLIVSGKDIVKVTALTEKLIKFEESMEALILSAQQKTRNVDTNSMMSDEMSPLLIDDDVSFSSDLNTPPSIEALTNSNTSSSHYSSECIRTPLTPTSYSMRVIILP
jgi:hypothetical protein